MGKLEAVERAQGRKLLVVVAVHLVEHRALAVDNLVVRVRQHVVFRESVHHREGQPVMVVAAEVGVELHVIERVVHEAHVPLEAEAEPARIGGRGDERKCRRLLRDGYRPRVLREHRRVELAQEIHRSEVYVAAFLIRGVLPVAPAIVEVEHRAYRVDAYAVDVVLLKEQARRGYEEALHLIRRVVKDHRAPLGVLRHACFFALKEGRAVKSAQTMLVLREVRRDPVHYHREPSFVQPVDKILKIVGIAVARGRRVVARDLIAP